MFLKRCGLAILLALPVVGFSQAILFDQPIKAGTLTFFPDVKTKNKFYYLPNQIKIATNEDGQPLVSMTKWVRNSDLTPEVSIITESTEGGGIIHAVVVLEVSKEQLKEAERALKRQFSNAKIAGPIVFQSGNIALISSFNQPDGTKVKKVVGLGTAPILEGSKAALSVELTKQGAAILWATFDSPAPDFSVSFEMEVKGYSSPKQAIIEADWDRIYKHQTFEAAIATPILSGEIKKAVEELYDAGAIKVDQIGEDANMEQLMESIIAKLTDLMFTKQVGSGVPPLQQLGGQNQKSMLDRAEANLAANRKSAVEYNNKIATQENRRAAHEETVRVKTQQARNGVLASQNKTYVAPPNGGVSNTVNNNRPDYQSVPTIAATVSYVMKDVRHSGQFKLNFNKYSSEIRTFRFDENLGNVKAQCPDCFRRVNLDDPLNKERNIFIRLDGLSYEDLKNSVNSVEVLVKKIHENGVQTINGITVGNHNFNQDANQFILKYGWKGDDNRTEWLKYEYKTRWNFFGNYSFETDWTTEEFSSITLNPPLLKQRTFIELDPYFVEEEAVKAVDIRFFYSIKGDQIRKRKTLRISRNQLSETIDLLLPKNVYDFEYQATYFINRKPPILTNRISSTYGMIYLDQFPLSN